ncbi:MAG: DUF4860 domain-containing protein [Clostridiaceae bacterium]|jgi:hypothetical protein|nr:DUF4860 domain-containing protein [Clostridiaceae bacterium]
MKEVLKNLNLKQKNGRVLIETICAMLLLVLLGAGCFSLSFSTFGAYERLNASKEKSSELRVASSFIMTKIRQNDVAGGLDVKPDSITGNNALIIYENLDGEDYDTWIYYNAGYIMEALVLKGEEPSIDVSQTIAKVDSFQIDYNREKNQIITSVGINGLKAYKSTIKVRSK